MDNTLTITLMILWTALSLAMGLELRAEIRHDHAQGVPCITRLNQVFCMAAGPTYPSAAIEKFIDENKALMKRMFGDFDDSTTRTKRNIDPDLVEDEPFMTADKRQKRQSGFSNIGNPRKFENYGQFGSRSVKRQDSCNSTVEIVTPYWAKNSGEKLRAIVNTQHWEQAIHQETCNTDTTSLCNSMNGRNCRCEQKYKWHRLLAYDPDDECRGIFMDWFIFPSCCVCRCLPFGSNN